MVAQHTNMSQRRKSLYYLSNKAGIRVYGPQNALIGITTSFRSIAHNGKCIGSIQVNTGDEDAWISGYGVHVEGVGIQWTDLGPEGRELFYIRNMGDLHIVDL